jgi:hypothetical protein
LQLTKVLLYDKMVRKILTSLVFFVLLSFCFAFTKQNATFAATCAQLATGGVCQSAQQCSVQGSETVSGATDCATGQVCCAHGTAPTVNAVPIGQYGCSFKNDSASTPVIPCATGSACKSVPPYSTFNSSTNTTENGYCQDARNQCAICDTTKYQYNFYTGKCDSNASGQASVDPTITACPSGQSCSYGYGCGTGNPPAPQPLSVCQNGTCKTALGPLPTDLPSLLTRVFSIALSIAGVVALGLIIASGYRLMISQGNPEQVKGAREQLTAAIIGLLFIIFSLIILQIIGFNILKIPGFGA